MQHETSIQHKQNIESGLTVEWFRTSGDTDKDFSVVCYSDQSRWMFDNGSAEQLTLLGEVSDGLGKAEILKTETGAIIALYQDGPQAFEDSEAWIESMPEVDKSEAKNLLNQ